MFIASILVILWKLKAGHFVCKTLGIRCRITLLNTGSTFRLLYFKTIIAFQLPMLSKSITLI